MSTNNAAGRGNKLAVIVVAAIAAYAWYGQRHARLADAPSPMAPTFGASASPGDSALSQAFDNQTSNVQVHGQGRVTKILPDDTEGSPHQRFIVRLSSGQTIMIAYNNDLASRIAALGEGDAIEFSGEYEWNPKGGVVHWTHRDPGGRHPAGWIKHNGHLYQ
jgi:Protein of unknown function (DUF3465)